MNEKQPFDHVLIIMFENQYRSYVMENDYFRSLAAQGINMANYFGVMHPSQPNYIASIAGELCNVCYDEQPPLLSQQTIVDLLEQSKLSWKAYMDSYTPQPWTADLTPKDEYPYVIKHNPFSSFENIVRNKERWQRIQSDKHFWEDVKNGQLPNYAWFSPDMWNDGHYIQGTHKEPKERAPQLVDQAAEWLSGFFGKLGFPGANSLLPPRTLVVVTFDEADFEAAWKEDQHLAMPYDGPNQIYTVLLGDMIAPAIEYEGYNHYSLLRTIEKNFDLSSLGKNDAQANYFQFLWGREFAWTSASRAPMSMHGEIAAAEFDGHLYVVYAGRDGRLHYRTFNGKHWSLRHRIRGKTTGAIRLAVCNDKLMLAYQVEGQGIHTLTYESLLGWSLWIPEAQPMINTEVKAFDLVAYDDNRSLMLAYRDADDQMYSLTYQEGKWATSPTPVGFKTGGSLALAVLGASLYLIYHAQDSQQMKMVSYNTTIFNVLKVPSGGKVYDYMTINTWSPSEFPVTHFSDMGYSGTPKEREPKSDPYSAGSPLTTATLDGVLYLAHPHVSDDTVVRETFSLHGIMTPAQPVSYDPVKTKEYLVNVGFGTLMQAGWSTQEPIADVHHTGAMTIAQYGSKLILLYQPEAGKAVRIYEGQYVYKG